MSSAIPLHIAQAPTLAHPKRRRQTTERQSGQRSPPERRRAAQDEQRGRQQRGPEVEGAQALSEYRRRRPAVRFSRRSSSGRKGVQAVGPGVGFCFHRRGRVVVGMMMMVVVVVIAG